MTTTQQEAATHILSKSATTMAFNLWSECQSDPEFSTAEAWVESLVITVPDDEDYQKIVQDAAPVLFNSLNCFENELNQY